MQNRPGAGLPTNRCPFAFYLHAICMQFNSESEPSDSPHPTRETSESRILGRSSKAFVPSPSPTSLVFARTPRSSWALLRCPPSWRSGAAKVARGPGPQTGTPLPATLQGPLSALQGAAPLPNGGQVGGGGLAKQGCDRARAGERTCELRWGRPLGKVGASSPAG